MARLADFKKILTYYIVNGIHRLFNDNYLIYYRVSMISLS